MCDWLSDWLSDERWEFLEWYAPLKNIVDTVFWDIASIDYKYTIFTIQ